MKIERQGENGDVSGSISATLKRSAARWLFSILVLLTSCQSNRKTHVLRLAHGLDKSHAVHKAMVFMSEELERLSKGQMELKIYSNGQLGSERECLELLQVGSLDMTKVSAAVMENFAPIYEILSLPYVFRDRDHVYRVLDGSVGEDLLNEGSEFRLKGLCFYDAGSRSFYTRDKPVKRPEDLQGLKVRVQKSKTAVDMVNLLGAAPTPIAWGELYTALQQGVVDGAENNPPSFYLSRHFEVCKYYSINEHASIPDVLLIGTTSWNRLSGAQQNLVNEAARRSVEYQRNLWQISEAESLEKLIAEGVEVSYPDKDAFVESVQSMRAKYMMEPTYKSLIKRIEVE